jgi:hypothetical protein
MKNLSYDIKTFGIATRFDYLMELFGKYLPINVVEAGILKMLKEE